MSKIIASITFLLVFSMSLLGTNVVPVVKLPAKPTKHIMSDADLYVEKVLDYYTASVFYKAQLYTMGFEPTKELIAPTLKQLSNPSPKVLQFQWKQASDLHTQVSKLEVTATNPNEAALRRNIYDLQTKLSSCRVDSEKLVLALKELEIYRELYKNVNVSNDTLKKQLNRHIVPTLGFSVGVNALLFSDENISSTAGTNLGMIFNPTTLLGTDLFDVWFDYSNPNIKVNHFSPIGNNLETLVHNTNVLSLGTNVVLPLSKILEIEKCLWTIKGGVGYYWIDDKTPNTIVANNLWKGIVLKVETEFINLASRFPFGIYISATFNRTNSDLMLYHPNNNYYNYYNNINFGSKWFNSLNAGLRFYLTGSYK